MRHRAWMGVGLAFIFVTHMASAQEMPGSPAPLAVPAAGEPVIEPPLRIKALPDKLDEAVGTWDLSLQGANRRCTLALSIDNGRNGRVLRFPAGCRRALPILGKVAGWLYLETGIRFVDESIRPVLLFTPSADRGSLLAKTESGETYNFVPLQTMGMLPADVAKPGRMGSSPIPASGRDGPTIPDVAGSLGIPGAEPVLAADTLHSTVAQPRPEGQPGPGTYALDRFAEKDVCRIELGSTRIGARAEKDLAEARVLPGCRDNGLAIFDPIAWRFANGHITLKARKGHAINLVATREGTWRRDPDTGVAFVLRKIE